MISVPVSIVVVYSDRSGFADRVVYLPAVVYHHGKSAAGGHYTTNLRQQSGNWINIDDTTIRPVLPGDVAVDRERELSRLGASGSPLSDPIPDKSAYLLIYTRYHGL